MKHLVFVYGTLKAGHYNHRALTLGGTSKLVFDDAFVKGQMFDLGAYPAVTEGSLPVKGEVWEVDDQTLERLDHLEGHPRFYVRVQAQLMNGGRWAGPSPWIFMYHMPKDRLPKNAVPMPVGNWPLKR